MAKVQSQLKSLIYKTFFSKFKINDLDRAGLGGSAQKMNFARAKQEVSILSSWRAVLGAPSLARCTSYYDLLQALLQALQ
jgi:hypothetical protein